MPDHQFIDLFVVIALIFAAIWLGCSYRTVSFALITVVSFIFSVEFSPVAVVDAPSERLGSNFCVPVLHEGE